MISVAVCTWNRASLLRECLQTMTQLHTPAGLRWELLVVNNNCTDDTSSVVAAFARRLPVKEIVEKKLGLSHAQQRFRHVRARACTRDGYGQVRIFRVLRVGGESSGQVCRACALLR